jgi:hypothetical protein
MVLEEEPPPVEVEGAIDAGGATLEFGWPVAFRDLP